MVKKRPAVEAAGLVCSAQTVAKTSLHRDRVKREARGALKVQGGTPHTERGPISSAIPHVRCLPAPAPISIVNMLWTRRLGIRRWFWIARIVPRLDRR
jgi:hypothetical protein